MSEQQQQSVNDTTTTTSTTTTTPEENAVNTLMDSLLLEAGELQSMYKQWFKNVQNLSKAMQRERKNLSRKRTKRPVNQKPQKVLKKMRKFMEANCVDKEYDHTTGAYTRQLMMKTVSVYIQEKNIQNPENKKEWSGTNSTLKKLFGLDKPWYTFMQINGLLSRVVVKPKN